MTPRISRIRWTAILAAMLCAPVVRAATPRPAPRVLLIVDRADDPFAERIRGEVAGLGLAVVTLEPWRTHESLGPLETVARDQRAVAVIRMLPSRKGVEVWMADETSGRSLLRQLIVDESAHGPNQSLIALQTVELLRTSLLSRPGAPGSASTGTATTPATAHSATGGSENSPTVVAGSEPASSAEVDLDAAFGVLIAPGGGAAAFQAWLSLRRTIGPRLALALDLSGPLRAATLSGPEGSARVGAYLAGATLLARLLPPGSSFMALVGGGLAIIDVRATGETTAPLAASSASAATGAVFGRADGTFEATRWLKLGARAVAGVATSRVALQFAGNDAGTWGRPFLAGFLLADLSWR